MTPPGSKFYSGGSHSIIEYRPPGPYSIRNMDPGSIFHGVHILYDTDPMECVAGRYATDRVHGYT